MKSNKKILSLMLMMLMFMSVFTTGTGVYAANYNATSALTYAANNWNNDDGEQCAGFVSNCLKAGGINIMERVCNNLFNALKNTYGTAYVLTVSSNRIPMLENKDKLSPGDPVFYFCNTCSSHSHVVLCSGTDANGYMKDYAHNSPHNDVTSWTSWACSACGTINWTMYSVHMGINEINVGDYIQLGNYLGEPITWRCVGIDDNGPLLLSDKVLCFKSYDAKGNYSNSYRRSNGSNNWAETTLRHWLNSYGEVDWSNRISVPSNENMYYKKGGYDKELGFLTSFSEQELKCIKTVTLKTYLNSADSSIAAGGTSEYNLPYADYADFFIEDMASRGKNKWYINTTDKVFILDPEQTAMCYFNLGEEFTCNPGATEAAFKNEKTGLKDRIYYSIWMRVPATQGMSYQNNGAITYTDSIHKINSGVTSNAEDVGVRPAFYLDMDNFYALGKSPSETPPVTPEKPNEPTEPSTPDKPSTPSTPDKPKNEGNIFTQIIDFFKNIINKILSIFKW